MKNHNNKTFIIAEIGPNHNGSYKRAVQMINKLSTTGVDAVKFQLGDPDLIYSDDSFFANYQKVGTKFNSVKELSQKNQLSKFEHLKLSKICKKKKLIYLCSAFDLKSLRYLDKVIKIPIFKIPSGEIHALDTLDYISKSNKPILISTGMATFKELNTVFKILNKKKKI